MFRRWIILCLTMLLTMPAAYAQPYEHPYPDALKIGMETEIWPSETHGDVSVDLPVTARESVNTQLRDAAQALLQGTEDREGSHVDMTAAYRISGTKWAGFLCTARIVLKTRAQSGTYTTEDTLGLSYQALTFDMETSQPLTLQDVFASGSSAWPMIEATAREMLYSYYPREQRNEEMLDSMVTKEALETAAFLPSAGQLLVPFPLAEILPGHWQIAYLILPYPDYRALMTPQAMLQTDNSTRPMIALTFDDGPTRTYSQAVLDGLSHYGAGATFFCVGNAIRKQPDILRREMDLGHTVAAHSMTHTNPWEQPAAEMQAEYDQQKQLFTDVTGLPALLFRPPGGDLKTYVTRQVGWPLIRWNKSGSDTGPDYARDVARRVINTAAHGDIVLMHDTKKKTADAVPLLLEALTERGFMFATVDELLYLNGVTPQPNIAYYDGLGLKIYSGE